jgi:hypothetical protein
MNKDRIENVVRGTGEVVKLLGLALRFALDPRTDPYYIEMNRRWKKTRLDNEGQPERLSARIRRTFERN